MRDTFIVNYLNESTHWTLLILRKHIMAFGSLVQVRISSVFSPANKEEGKEEKAMKERKTTSSYATSDLVDMKTAMFPAPE